ncbi:MAG: phage holin family protein [Ottowia sp.]|nr:phage holin family protein [Ottowia sp.]
MLDPANTTAARLRRLLANVLELARLRLELLGVEARQDLARLVVIAMQAVVAAILLGFGLVFLALLATLLLWDTHRVLALGVSTAVFWLLGLLLVLRVREQLRQGLRLFSSTIDELRRDEQEFRT